ncbi:hypothetical protein [Streptomyces coffeae]|nr:hypothetical protein [Streptomyces coffeae]
MNVEFLTSVCAACEAVVMSVENGVGAAGAASAVDLRVPMRVG